jgi:hypothetical protein
MGSITRGLSNNITTGGVILPAGITNASVSAVTSFANASGGTLILLSTQTASNSATISFTTGLDSTYDAYEFKFIDIFGRSSGEDLVFQCSTNAGSSYGVAITSTAFRPYNNEAGTDSGIGYLTSSDLAQSTSFQQLTLGGCGADADKNMCGSLQLYNPSSTTYVKHFIGNTNQYSNGNYSIESFVAGYVNTTSAINAVQFKMSSGNLDGVFKLYGVKKS